MSSSLRGEQKSSDNILVDLPRDPKRIVLGYLYYLPPEAALEPADQLTLDVITEINALKIKQSQDEDEQLRLEALQVASPFINHTDLALDVIQRIASQQGKEIKLDPKQSPWKQLVQCVDEVKFDRWFAAEEKFLQSCSFDQTQSITAQFFRSQDSRIRDAGMVPSLVRLQHDLEKSSFAIAVILSHCYDYWKLLIEANLFRDQYHVMGDSLSNVLLDYIIQSNRLDILEALANSHYFGEIEQENADKFFKFLFAHLIPQNSPEKKEESKQDDEKQESKQVVILPEDIEKRLEIARTLSRKYPKFYSIFETHSYNYVMIAAAKNDKNAIEVLAGFTMVPRTLPVFTDYAVEHFDINLYKKAKRNCMDLDIRPMRIVRREEKNSGHISINAFVKLMLSSDARANDFLQLFYESTLETDVYLKQLVKQKIDTGFFVIEPKAFSEFVLNTEDTYIVKILVKLCEAKLQDEVLTPTLVSELISKTSGKIKQVLLNHRKRKPINLMQLVLTDTTQSKFNLHLLFEKYQVGSFGELVLKIPEISRDIDAVECIIFNAYGYPELEKLLIDRLVDQGTANKRTLFHYMAEMKEYTPKIIKIILKIISKHVDYVVSRRFFEAEAKSSELSSDTTMVSFLKPSTKLSEISDQFIKSCWSLEDSQGNTVAHLLAVNNDTEKFDVFNEAGELSFDIDKNPTPLELKFSLCRSTEVDEISALAAMQDWVETLLTYGSSLSTMRYFLKRYNPPLFQSLESDRVLTQYEKRYKKAFSKWCGDSRKYFVQVESQLLMPERGVSQVDALQTVYGNFAHHRSLAYAILRINTVKAYKMFPETDAIFVVDQGQETKSDLSTTLNAKLSPILDSLNAKDKERFMRIHLFMGLPPSLETRMSVFRYLIELPKDNNKNDYIDYHRSLLITLRSEADTIAHSVYKVLSQFTKKASSSAPRMIDSQVTPLQAAHQLGALHAQALLLIFQIIDNTVVMPKLLDDFFKYKQTKLLTCYIHQLLKQDAQNYFQKINELVEKAGESSLANTSTKLFAMILDMDMNGPRLFNSKQSAEIAQAAIDFGNPNIINAIKKYRQKQVKPDPEIYIESKRQNAGYDLAPLLAQYKVKNIEELIPALLNQPDKIKDAIMCVIYNSIGYTHIEELLINSKDSSSRTLLHHLVSDQAERPGSIHFLCNCISMFMKYIVGKYRDTVFLLERDVKGMSPVHIAAQNADISKLNALSDSGKRPLNFKLKPNPTPIACAYESKHYPDIEKCVLYLLKHSSSAKEYFFINFGPEVPPEEREQEAEEWFEELSGISQLYCTPLINFLIELDYVTSRVMNEGNHHYVFRSLIIMMHDYADYEEFTLPIFINALTRINCYVALQEYCRNDHARDAYEDLFLDISKCIDEFKITSAEDKSNLVRARLLSDRDLFITNYPALICLSNFRLSAPPLAKKEIIRLDNSFKSYADESDENKCKYAFLLFDTLSKVFRSEFTMESKSASRIDSGKRTEFDVFEFEINKIRGSNITDKEKLEGLLKCVNELLPTEHPLRLSLQKTRVAQVTKQESLAITMEVKKPSI